MNVRAVMDALAARLSTIDGLRAYPYPIESVTPPAAVVAFPSSYVFDATYGRGHDDLGLFVILYVGRAKDAKATRDRLSAYLDGAGDASIKQVLEAEPLPDDIEAIRVRGVELDFVSLAGTEYLAAAFDLQIDGRGTA